eukprot:4013659-Pleurochrysis_carterae.AAC.1
MGRALGQQFVQPPPPPLLLSCAGGPDEHELVGSLFQGARVGQARLDALAQGARTPRAWSV